MDVSQLWKLSPPCSSRSHPMVCINNTLGTFETGVAKIFWCDCLQQLVTLDVMCAADRHAIRQVINNNPEMFRAAPTLAYHESTCEGCDLAGGMVGSNGASVVLTENLGTRPEITTRNLLYHVCALSQNNDWIRNIKNLLKHVHIFNGRRIIAIAYSETEKHRFVAPNIITDWFKTQGDFEFLVLPNDKILREVATFYPLLKEVAQPDPHTATFYAHTKGNSTQDHVAGAKAWSNCMYHNLLGRWQEVMYALSKYTAVGTTMHDWGPIPVFPWPSRIKYGHWMFCGTFFWFRNDGIFSLPNWDQIVVDRYGAEAWLGGIIPSKEAYSMYQPWNPLGWRKVNPYLPQWYPDYLKDSTP